MKRTAKELAESLGTTLEGDIVIVAAGSWSHQIRGLEADRVVLHPVRGQVSPRPKGLGRVI